MPMITMVLGLQSKFLTSECASLKVSCMNHLMCGYFSQGDLINPVVPGDLLDQCCLKLSNL